MGAGFRLYAEDHPALARTLRAKLEKRQVELGGQLMAGSAQDWPDYKQRLGVIRGLQEAIDLCADEEKSQNGDR
jgi:hypothetical protein